MVNVSPQGQEPRREGSQGLGFLTQVMLVVVALSLAWTIYVIVMPFGDWLPEATRQAGEVDNLFKFMLAAGGAIFILVQVLLVAFVLHFRRRQGDPSNALGAQMHGNTRLEVAWAAAPSLLVIVLIALTMSVWTDEHTRQKNELQLHVNGFQYGWNFDLPQYNLKNVGGNPNDPVTIPVDQAVYVTEYSHDVIHSFWVPEFRIKQDDVPGQTPTHELFTTTRIGLYRVICTEFCGSGHSTMVTKIAVVSRPDFAKWVLKHGGKLPPGATTAEVVRR